MAILGRRALAALVLAPGAALAQAPARRTPAPAQAAPAGPASAPQRLISPFPEGGNDDRLNRHLAACLSRRIGGPAVEVEPRPGPNSLPAVEALTRAAPDGRTFLVTNSATTMNNLALFPAQPSHPARDLVPVSLLTVSNLLFAAPAGAPFSDLRGLLRWVDRQGRAVTYGSWGMGSTAHVFGELLKLEQGVPLEHVTYPNQPSAVADMVAGRVDLTFVSPMNAIPALRDGTLKVIGVVGDRRSALVPNVPTFAEQGLPGFDLPSFTAAYLPGGAARPVADALSAALRGALEDPGLRAAMLDQGHTPIGSTPAELAALQARDAPRWAALIGASGVRLP